MTNVEMNMHRSTRFVILSEQSEAKDDKRRGSAQPFPRWKPLEETLACFLLIITFKTQQGFSPEGEASDCQKTSI